MDNTERIALLRRAADCCAIVWETCGDRQDGQDQLALRALAADLAATPPAPWLPAPDGPGDWWAGRPNYKAIAVEIDDWDEEIGPQITPQGQDWSIPLSRWISETPGVRFARRTPVIVPAEEPAP